MQLHNSDNEPVSLNSGSLEYCGKVAVPYSTIYTYDALGRVLTQATPIEEKDGVIYCKVNRNDFDAAGNVLAQKTTSNLPGEAESYTHTASVYDSRGRVVDTVIYDGDKPGSHTRYEYDGVGNRIAVYTGVTDDPGDASKTSYAYNYLNKVASITDALGQMESYVYDSTGLLTEKTDRNGNTTTCLYDAMARPVSEMVMDPDSRVTALRNTAYTKTGSKLSEENDTFQTTFQYDCMGRVIRETETGGVVKAYGHDWNGNRTAFTLDKGAENVLSTGYDYDKLNRMYIVREQGETIATYTYDDNGNRASLSYPEGTVTTYTYNLANMATRLVNENGGEILSAYEYT